MADSLGMFATPQQIQAAELQRQAADPNAALRASLLGVGQAGAGAFSRAFGGEGVPLSPEVQLAKTRQEVMQGIDLTDKQSLVQGSQALVNAGDIAGAQQLAKQALAIKPPETKEIKGDYFQRIKNVNGKPVQLGTSFVPKGQEIPQSGEGESWLKIGTGLGSGDTHISVGAEQDAFAKSLGTQEATKFSDQRKSAQTSVDSLRTATESIKLLDEGVITGTGAPLRLGLAKALNFVGATEDETVANTEAFLANQGKAVLNIVGSGAVGAGTGISDKDIQFIKEVVGGVVTLDEPSLRRIFTISEKAHRNKIDIHNRQAREVDKKVKLPYSTQIEVPVFFDPDTVEQKARNNKGQIIYNVNGQWVDNQGYRYE